MEDELQLMELKLTVLRKLMICFGKSQWFCGFQLLRVYHQLSCRHISPDSGTLQPRGQPTLTFVHLYPSRVLIILRVRGSVSIQAHVQSVRWFVIRP